MKIRTLVCASAFGCMWGFTAKAQQVPRLNIEATCKTEQPLVAGDADPYEGCMKDEMDAERQL